MTVRTNTKAIEEFAAGGNIFRLIDDGSATGGAVAIFECDLPPGWPGPPQHVHHEQDEMFYVVSGTVRVTSGDQTTIAPAGTLVTIPIGDPHTFGNASSDVGARLLATVSPARNFEYFRDLAALPTTAEGRLEPSALLAFMADYATEPYAADAPVAATS
jgi:quercetin dioxygenase-like cupin family protein